MAPHVVNTSTDALLGSFIKCTAGSFLYTSLLIRYNLLAQTKWSDRTWHHWPAAALDSWSAVSPRALDHNLQILGIHRLCVSSQLSSHSDVSVWTVLGSRRPTHTSSQTAGKIWYLAKREIVLFSVHLFYQKAQPSKLLLLPSTPNKRERLHGAHAQVVLNSTQAQTNILPVTQGVITWLMQTFIHTFSQSEVK